MERIGEVRFLHGNRVDPLIEASETYSALEGAISQAERCVHMAYWTIDPTMEVISDQRAESWGELIAQTVSRGVTVRLIIADFDPVLGRKYHAAAWSSYRRLMTQGARLERDARERLQFICSRHEARVGSAVRLVGQPIIQAQLLGAVKEMNELLRNAGPDEVAGRLGELPGLWPLISYNGHEISLREPCLPTVYPAAHHEKLCVIDDQIVYLGGLDINDRRYDTVEHEETLAWHDVGCRLEGSAAGFFAHHFRRRWNSELGDFLDFINTLEPPCGVERLVVSPLLKGLSEEVKTVERAAGSAAVAPLRTMSKQAKSSFSRSPQSDKTEILDAYLEAVAIARDLIYIETQFLRSEAIVDALVACAERSPALEFILLLPLVPEEVLTSDEPDIATKHGRHLQRQALIRLREAFGDRMGVFTLIRSGSPVPDPENQPAKTERDIVYVHAKVMVVDELLSIVGSANLNDRSMRTDTETAIAWKEPGAVRRFRDRLWQHALGFEIQHWNGGYVRKWTDHAARNAKLPPAQRQGFLMPLPQEAVEAYAESSILVPGDLV